MWKDPIVEKVRRTRSKIAAEFDYDMEKYSQYIVEQEKKHPERMITLEKMKKKYHVGTRTKYEK